ncbi:MAG: polysaccharide biosynthesis C-terminal domain-containing protein [Ruminococcus sp.]|nr:polysaccharide biosynthesis C-terminal domain-containing protein [Ruminococcus sp.]
MRISSELKNFSKYVTLNIIGMIGLSCYILADTFFIAKGLGSKGLTALNLALPLFSLLNGIGLMLGIGGASRYTVLKNQGDAEGANSVFTHTVFFGAVFSVIFFCLGCFIPKQLAVLVGADSEMLGMTGTYISVLWMFSPFFIFNDIMQSFIRNDNSPHLSMAGMIIGSMSNIVLDYIFIFPLNMGIFGAILATGISPCISLAVISFHFIKRKNTFHLTPTSANAGHIKYIFSGGLTAFVGEMSTGIVIMIFNTILLQLSGNIAVAGYGVIANISMVVISVFNGLAQGIQPLCSRFYGTGNRNSLQKILHYAIVLSFIIAVLIYLSAFFGADYITMIFNSNNDAELQKIAVHGIKLYFIGSVFAGINITVAIYFVSVEQPLFANIISISRGFAVIIPVTIILSSLWKITGLWLAFTVAEGIVTVLSYILYITYKRKN